MTNEYLQHLLDFQESDVPFYNKKIKLFLIGGYSHALSACVICFLANYVVAFLIAILDISNIGLDDIIMNFITLILVAIISFITSFKLGKKRMHKYIDINHGEIGHKNNNMYLSIKKNGTIFAIITGALTIILLLLYFVFGVKNILTVDTFDVLHYSSIIIGSVAFYFFGAISYCNSAKYCPYCHRINTFCVKKISSIGNKFEGYSTSISSRYGQVGTKITTYKTTYSDGSVNYSTSSSPIYGNIYTEHTYENSSTIDSYLFYCTECPGSDVSTSVELHKKEVSRHEL